MNGFNAALRYGLIVMVVIAIAVAYVYRHQLFPAFFVPHKVDKREHSVRSADKNNQQENSTQLTSTDNQDSISKQNLQIESQARAEPRSNIESEEQPVVIENEREKQIQVATESEQRRLQNNHSGEMDTAALKNKPNRSSGAGETQQSVTSTAQNDEVNERSASERQANANLQQRSLELLNNARQAHWQGQYNQAIDSYQKAIEIQPNNPDIYGELGNIYYSQGKWEQAGENYYQAAVRLIRYNRPDLAYNLLSIISGLKKDRATELQQQLNALQQRQIVR